MSGSAVSFFFFFDTLYGLSGSGLLNKAIVSVSGQPLQKKKFTSVYE